MPRTDRARLEHFDERPGGSYRLVLTCDDPSASAGKAIPESDIVDARFVDLAPNDVPDGISAEDRAEGLTSSLQNLAAFVVGR